MIFKKYCYLNYYNCFLIKKYIENNQNNKIKKIKKIGNINKIKMIDIMIKNKSIIKITNEKIYNFYDKTNNKRIKEIIINNGLIPLSYWFKDKIIINFGKRSLSKSSLIRDIVNKYPEFRGLLVNGRLMS